MKIQTGPSYAIAGVNHNQLLKLKAPEARDVLETIDPKTKQTFVARFNAEWSSLDPQTRNRMLGGVGGGVIAGSATAAALSVRQISQLISNRPMAVFAMTALGTAIGAFAPDAMKYFQSSNVDWESPTWANMLVGKTKVTGKFASANGRTTLAKPTKAKTRKQD